MVQPPWPRKQPSKGKDKASEDESDSETAIRVTLGGKNRTKGVFVDEESYFYDAPVILPPVLFYLPTDTIYRRY